MLLQLGIVVEICIATWHAAVQFVKLGFVDPVFPEGTRSVSRYMAQGGVSLVDVGSENVGHVFPR